MVKAADGDNPVSHSLNRSHFRGLGRQMERLHGLLHDRYDLALIRAPRGSLTGFIDLVFKLALPAPGGPVKLIGAHSQNETSADRRVRLNSQIHIRRAGGMITL